MESSRMEPCLFMHRTSLFWTGLTSASSAGLPNWYSNSMQAKPMFQLNCELAVFQARNKMESRQLKVSRAPSLVITPEQGLKIPFRKGERKITQAKIPG